jgi:hypothetical protein
MVILDAVADYPKASIQRKQKWFNGQENQKNAQKFETCGKIVSRGSEVVGRRSFGLSDPRPTTHDPRFFKRPRLDSNQRISDLRSDPLPLGYSAIGKIGIAGRDLGNSAIMRERPDQAQTLVN